MSRVYRHPQNVDIPNIDLLSLLFDSELCAAQEDTPLHFSATNTSIFLTKASLRALAERIAFFLQSRFGVGAQGRNKDVVVVMTSGQPAAPAAFYGIIAAGGVFSAASPSFTPEELVRQIKQGKGNLVVVSEDSKEVGIKAAKICGIPLKRVLVLTSEPEWGLKTLEGGLALNWKTGNRLTWKRVTDYEELKKSLIVLLYSSGTTGVPKGVMLSHLNLVAELYIPSVQGREWAAKEVEEGRELPEYRTLAHLPVAHIAGLYGYFIAPTYSGGAVYWMRKFSWKPFLQHMKDLQITIFYTVPSIFLRIAKSADVTDQFRTVQTAITGAAPMDGELQQAANAKLGTGDVRISQTWGLSETTGAVTIMPRGDSDITGSISPIMPNMEMRIVNEEWHDVDPGQPGEVIVRGPLVTQGYYDNPIATQETFHDDWFCTGDIAVDRGGKFYILDRKKELLKYKGLQIAPAELESLLDTHPAIQEAAIVGVPIEGGSEVPRAYIVADPGKISENEVKDFVKSKLANYKQLRGGVVYVDELPKNANGKILRRELRDRAKKEVGQVSAKL
ncbi:acetyl-CoA synthetase-like protein [Mytilinidion resinicola]|uniref:Acetyl-CoA synthetase-like protein n=1 Tax=Mytilinidion resinicola TaxID=574789 RepID=A0A6A6Z5T9_9PEZI|nr:acetyl-CoA synthetase-like protein [Mytilinidion resinicola]KAF2816390.1 acetyl-CoA synthetase-like protein [Mytilinidion resinicola]